jgi:membrane protein YqaA with SNARE-associated domain
MPEDYIREAAKQAMPVTNNSTTNHKDGKEKAGWGRRIASILTILLVVAITVGLFLFRDNVSKFESYGYLGAFLISLIANATIILPMPGLLILIGLGATFNPLLVALIGAAGGALGELSGYLLGRSGRGITSNNRWYTRAEHWMKKQGFLTVFAFALLPFLPLDIAGLIAGVSRYSVWKFLAACMLGKGILYIIMIYTGAWGWDWLVNLMT